jgi:regulatory protein
VGNPHKSSRTLRLASSRSGSVDVRISGVRGKVATLHPREVTSLRLSDGMACTDSLEEKIRDAQPLSAARRLALSALKRRALSTSRMREYLVRRGVDASLAAHVIKDLVAIGAINDAAIAESVIAMERSRRPAGTPLLRQKLARHGIDEADVDQAITAAEQVSSAREQAMAEARRTAARLPASLDPRTRARRILAALARRGFDEQTAEDAARAVLGSEWPTID